MDKKCRWYPEGIVRATQADDRTRGGADTSGTLGRVLHQWLRRRVGGSRRGIYLFRLKIANVDRALPSIWSTTFDEELAGAIYEYCTLHGRRLPEHR